MQTTDPYLQEAFTAAQRFAANDSRFQLVDGPLIRQGLNNRVLRGTFDEQPVIAKYYGDGFRWNISADLRKQRELTFLRHAEDTGLVPKVIAVYDRFILLEVIKGQPLEELRRTQGWRIAPIEIAKALGKAHRILSDLHLTPADLRTIEANCFNGKSLQDRISELLKASEKMSESDCFGNLERETLRKIRATLSELLAGPKVFYKYDNNFGNVLVDVEGHLRGLIDFEQCYIGTPLLYLGAVFDCAHAIPWGDNTQIEIYQQLPWDALLQGYSQSSPSLNGKMPLVIIAAILNHWMRVTEVLTRHGNLTSRLSRLSARFETYMRFLQNA